MYFCCLSVLWLLCKSGCSSLFCLFFLPSFESFLKAMTSAYREESYSNLTWPIYKHCFLTLAWSSLVLLRMKSFFFPTWSVFCVCVCLAVNYCGSISAAMRLYPPVGAGPPHSLLETAVTLDLSEIQPREMLRNYLFNPRKLFLFEVNWLKRFWFAAALETVCYDLDFFFFYIL